MNPCLNSLFCLILGATLACAADDAGFKSLFNGKDLAGWDGNPKNWSVQDGCLTGITTEADVLPYNQFLIWRGGTVKNFELRAKIKQAGNNSGIQYRSKELKEIGPWSVGGYQCDIHPAAANNAMLYEEKGRGILVQNSQTVTIDPQGVKWLVEQRDPVKVNVEEWNDYSILAQGNKISHRLNGQVTMELIDHQADKRSLEGILALQIHRGPAMKVQVKDVLLKVLPEGGVLSPEEAPVPASAKKIEAEKAGAKKGGAKKKAN